MAFENSGLPWATQAGSYSAEQTRRAVFASYARTAANNPGIISGGLISSADLQLSAAVSGLVVYVSTGEAIIPGNEGGAQGGYYARNTTQISITLATANASNPRIDLICLTVDDSGYTPPTGGTSGQVTAQAITGTATPGATLTNLNGVGTLPGSSLLLGYVLVPAAATNLTSGDIKNVAVPVSFQQSVSWTALTLAGSWTTLANTYTPAVAIIGNRAILTGTLYWASGSPSNPAATVPSAAVPAKNVYMSSWTDVSSTYSASAVTVIGTAGPGTAGQLTIAGSGSAPWSISLEGLSYRLS